MYNSYKENLYLGMKFFVKNRLYGKCRLPYNRNL